MAATGCTSVTQERMVLAWALAEPHEWGEGRPEALVRKLRPGVPLTLAEEAEARDWFLRGRRGEETRTLRELRPRWFEADFRFAELGDAVLHPHWALRHWEQHAPSTPPPRTVANFAARSDVPEGFSDDRTPDPNEGHPPIFIATGLEATPRIAEGNHRAVALWRAHRRGSERYQGTFRIILGLHPQIDTWADFLR